MELMFSNTDEELAKQVDNDIKSAQKNGVVDTEEIKYEKTNNGDDVAITDKETGEVTIAQKNPDEADTYDLIAVPDGQLEKFVHPSADGVTKGTQVGAPDEKVEDHFGEGDVIAPNLPDGGRNDEAGHEKSVEDTAKEGPQGADACPACGKTPCECDEEKEFSVSTDNTVLQRLFSMPQELVEYLFSEVIDSCETSKVGDLKIEKCEDEDNAVVVTSESTGDQAKVKLDDENMEVTELESKAFSNDEQFLPLFVVGVQPYDHIIIDAQEYSEESANELKAQLEEDGIEAVQIFDDEDQARDYAIGLLEALGADPANGDVDEPELQKEYSDAVGSSVYASSYRTGDTVFMSRMFSENTMGVAETRDAVEKAISGGKEIEFDGVVVTPIDAINAIITDGAETTKATIDGEDMRLENVSPTEAEAMKGKESILEVESDENNQRPEDEEEKEFSDVYTNDAETRYFSESEEMTDYMVRLFSEESDQNAIEAAIESGESIETDNEIITPIDDETAVVEDKENGEFTKVTLLDEDAMNVHPLGEDEAENLLGEGSEADEEEKEFSDIYTNDAETRYFSEDEEMTDYMVRLFSEEADQDHIEEAIESGKSIETDKEIIAPIDDETAIVKDKESGEFTKVTLLDEGAMSVHPLSEDEEEKEFSDVYTNDAETRYFSESEEMTDYMVRLFSEESDQDIIEEAIAEGEQIENDTEVVTPVNSTTAIVEDKENGEFSKAVIKDEDKIEVNKISEDEANKLTENLKVEEKEDEKDKEEEKEFSLISKFFASAGISATPAAQAPAAAPVVAPAQEAAPAVVVDPNAAGAPVEEAPAQPTLENIEDKALAAIQSIKAAVEEGAAQIMEAKAAPAVTAEPEIQEAQFSEKTFSQNEQNDTLISWLSYK